MEDENYILFDAYLSKELSEAERIAFENRLKTNTEFLKAFNTFKELSLFLKAKFENETESTAFKNTLKHVSKTHFKENTSAAHTKIKTRNLVTYLVAASVAIMLGIFTFNQFSAPSYNDYANYGAISLTVRGENDALLKTAEIAFNNKDFAKAEQAFKLLDAKGETNTELQFYRGIANIELNNFEVADAILNTLKNGTSSYKDDATWYLALSLLKQGKNDACLTILKSIPNDADHYSTVQKLIRKLK